jgi:FtsZ-interacting cell division protein YlmF
MSYIYQLKNNNKPPLPQKIITMEPRRYKNTKNILKHTAVTKTTVIDFNGNQSENMVTAAGM